MFKFFFSIFISILTIGSLSGQYIKPYVLADGACFKTETNISISYSIGEPAIRTVKTNENIFTEGFQQTYYSSIYPGAKNKIKVYPNPVDDFLKVSFEIEESNSYIVTIYSISGQTMNINNYKNLTRSDTYSYDFSSHPKGLYLIKIQSVDGQYFRTFKIEKL